MGLRIVMTACLLLVACTVTFEPPINTDANRKSVLDVAFTDPLIDGYKVAFATRYKEQLAAQIDDLHIDADYFSAYDNIKFVASGVYPIDVYWLDYQIEGVTRRAYAYSIDGGHNCGVLIIPGSGHNQAYEIFNGLGYHGSIASVMATECDTYIMIKPNEGVRAIHDDSRKLNYDFVSNRLVMLGGSYSETYLIEAMALAKALRSYENSTIMGLSQGGYAAMLVSLQADTDNVIVSSGWAIDHQLLYWSGQNQIAISGLQKVYTLDVIKQKIEAKKSDWLFTYGKKETGFYGDEANGIGETCAYLATMTANVECAYHDGGHEFPIEIIEAWK